MERSIASNVGLGGPTDARPTTRSRTGTWYWPAICHCLECRKATDAVAMTYADWRRSALTSSGEYRTHVGRSFCVVCGSRLFHLQPHAVEVLLGAFDDGPSDLLPTREGWIIRREPWLAPVAGAEQAERDPPKH